MAERRYPLVRAGLTQAARHLPERARDYFRPDPRDLADLVLFGQRFAAQVMYYDDANVEQGDWRAFFESDVTSALAGLAKLPVEAFRQFQADLERWLRADPTRDTAQLGAHFRLWFHLPLVLLEVVARHHGRLPTDHTLAGGLPRLVARDLIQPLGGLIGWYRGAVAAGLFADAPLASADFNTAGGGDARLRLSSTVAGALFGRPAFSALDLGPTLLPGGWPGLFAATPADGAPFADAVQPFPRIFDALTFNLLTRAVERLYQGLLRLRQDALSALDASLAGFAAHPPHYGLWLAFLKLFRHTQGEMNGFTGRHMDHYLREVLQLRPRGAEPDRAHLTFDLAKGVERHLLAKGTAFRAGKDALGRPVAFTLDDDLVLNRGRVALMSGLRIDTGGPPEAPTLTARASVSVASTDGTGAEPLPPGTAFPPFGPVDAPFARIGFSIADRRLFLREGTRSITLRAELSSPADAGLQPGFRVRLTGAEGWFEPEKAKVAARIVNDFTEVPILAPADKLPDRFETLRNPFAAAQALHVALAKGGRGAAFALAPPKRLPPTKLPTRIVRADVLEVTVTLGADDPAVVPLDPKLHGGEHTPGLPVIEAILDFAAPGTARALAALRHTRIGAVTVGATASGLKRLTVIAAGAEADPAKPFAPFGPRPKPGDALIVGSSEIFSKPIASLSLSVDWQTPLTLTSHFRKLVSYTATESVLSAGAWVAAGSGTALAVGSAPGTITLTPGATIDGQTAQSVENPGYDATSRSGFLRLRLNQDFGHHEWPAEQQRAMVALAKGEAHTLADGYNYDLPPPDLETIEVTRNPIRARPGAAAAASIDAPERRDGALPKLPCDPVLTRIEASYVAKSGPADSHRLLAPFGSAPAEGRLFPDLPLAGALYVGIADLVPPAKLTLLIQVEDGSGDPLLPVPDLTFAFLKGDSFVALDGQDVDDKTLNLTTSGVLGLAIPADADTDHRVLPAGLTWLRFSAPLYPDALNRLRSITAQAARVTFADRGNDPARLAAPLSAGSIAKQELPQPQVKTVAQPYPGFAGRPVETAPAMDTRVAERLRHKHRATTMWDVEALVLDAFPQLWRAKCLGLTELRRDAQGVVTADNELRPGAVTVVTVPRIPPGARDPLRPWTDQATLTAVANHLRPLLSPFVRLEVSNPRLEEVHLDFLVRFAKGIADIAFYSDRLNDKLVAHLTPWAGGGGEIAFGGRLWRSRIIDFLDEQPEVDFVTEVKMFHKIDIAAPAGGWTPIPLEVIEATTARSILVSARKHNVREVA